MGGPKQSQIIWATREMAKFAENDDKTGIERVNIWALKVAKDNPERQQKVNDAYKQAMDRIKENRGIA